MNEIAGQESFQRWLPSEITCLKGSLYAIRLATKPFPPFKSLVNPA